MFATESYQRRLDTYTDIATAFVLVRGIDKHFLCQCYQLHQHKDVTQTLQNVFKNSLQI